MQWWWPREGQQPHAQQLNWSLSQAYKWAHRRKVSHQVPSLWPDTTQVKNLRLKGQIFNTDLYEDVFPFYKNYTCGLIPLDFHVAAAVWIWPGCTYHTCQLGGKSSVRREEMDWGRIYYTRTPTFSLPFELQLLKLSWELTYLFSSSR